MGKLLEVKGLRTNFYTYRGVVKALVAAQRRGVALRVLLDPNTFSEDGTISLGGYAVSPDGTQAVGLNFARVGRTRRGRRLHLVGCADGGSVGVGRRRFLLATTERTENEDRGQARHHGGEALALAACRSFHKYLLIKIVVSSD